MVFHRNLIASAIFLTGMAGFSGVTLAADCGEAPVAPELADGTTATMDELIANSEAVKSFIADADTYLDCREDLMKSDEFKMMEEAVRASYVTATSELLDIRNSISEDFNEQVKIFSQRSDEEASESDD
jgi:hypothetical protein